MEKKVISLIKKTRLKLNQKIPDIAENLCISEAYIKAIENGDTKALPKQNVYTLGFVRTYANFLGLDGPHIATLFKKQNLNEEPIHLPEIEENELANDNQPSGKFLTRSLLVAGVVIVGGYIHNTSHLGDAVAPILEKVTSLL